MAGTLRFDHGSAVCGQEGGLSVHVVTMIFMSELPASDTHDVIYRGGAVVAVVVPIAEYQQQRQAAEEQRVNEEFDSARTEYLARRAAGSRSWGSPGWPGLPGGPA